MVKSYCTTQVHAVGPTRLQSCQYLQRMELWIDGTKIGQNLEDQLHVTTTLTKGTHTAAFVAVDTFDAYTTQSVTFTVR
jgi:hypothetical protein